MNASHLLGLSGIAVDFKRIVSLAVAHPFVHVQALPGTPHEIFLLMLIAEFIGNGFVTPGSIILVGRTKDTKEHLEHLLGQINRSDNPCRRTSSQQSADFRLGKNTEKKTWHFPHIAVMNASQLIRQIGSLERQQKKVLVCQDTLGVPEFLGMLSFFEHVIHFGRHDLPKRYEEWNFQVHRLVKQCHMRPEISDLVRASLATELRDHDSTFHLENVPGLVRNVSWLDHLFPEAKSPTSGFSNKGEAELCLSLVRHILCQESSQLSDVAILTPYRQQCKLLKRLCATPGLFISTLDAYRVGSIPILVVSLVRSNEAQSIGFLSNQDRIASILCRGQKGLYIVGSARTFQSCLPWNRVMCVLRASESIGAFIRLRCERHPSYSPVVSYPHDFDTWSPNGGCLQRCNRRLSHCVHRCKQPCHPNWMHEQTICWEPCLKLHKYIVCGQRCGECRYC